VPLFRAMMLGDLSMVAYAVFIVLQLGGVAQVDVLNLAPLGKVGADPRFRR
jgi:hypothetical protein